VRRCIAAGSGAPTRYLATAPGAEKRTYRRVEIPGRRRATLVRIGRKPAEIVMRDSNIDANMNQGQHPVMHPMTDYFMNDVLEKRPYIRLEWCLAALQNPVRREVQVEDCRIRHWSYTHLHAE